MLLPSAIPLEDSPTLAALFRQRLQLTPDKPAYIQFDAQSQSWVSHSWRETADQISLWQQAMLRDGLKAGDRIAISCANSWEWVICDQAALGLGMVLVPIFVNDRAENIAWIIQDSGARMLVLDRKEQWDALLEIEDRLAGLVNILSLRTPADHARVKSPGDWLRGLQPSALAQAESAPGELASIIYTSGTTGKPKGVMLSHHNILWNIHAALKLFDIADDNLFLSFLPLSHTFERTVGYYLPMVTGATIAYNRSIPQLAEDLETLKPTLMISVPRIFERIYGKILDKLNSESALKRKLFMLAVDAGWRKFEHQQGRQPWSPVLLLQPLLDHLVGAKVRQKLGGRMRFTVCGGAALSPDVARLFIGLGVPVQQGYGLTETSPVIAANPLANNLPASVGLPLPGIEVRISAEGELLVRSPSNMLGYWNNPAATRAIIDQDRWLHTGDKTRLDKDGHLFITGRLKEIIVLANGEKVPPSDIENAMVLDSYIEQAILIGEGKPYLSALIVPNPDAFKRIAEGFGLSASEPASYRDERIRSIFLVRVQDQLSSFPGYAQVRQITLLKEPLTPENGLLTPTLKLRRNRILDHYAKELALLYSGH